MYARTHIYALRNYAYRHAWTSRCTGLLFNVQTGNTPQPVHIHTYVYIVVEGCMSYCMNHWILTSLIDQADRHYQWLYRGTREGSVRWTRGSYVWTLSNYGSVELTQFRYTIRKLRGYWKSTTLSTHNILPVCMYVCVYMYVWCVVCVCMCGVSVYVCVYVVRCDWQGPDDVQTTSHCPLFNYNAYMNRTWIDL